MKIPDGPKSFEPQTRDSAPMSPPRWSLRRSTFNYFEDTLEIARLHITQADCSSRKRQSRAGTAAITRHARVKPPCQKRPIACSACMAWFCCDLPAVNRGDLVERGYVTAKYVRSVLFYSIGNCFDSDTHVIDA